MKNYWTLSIFTFQLFSTISCESVALRALPKRPQKDKVRWSGLIMAAPPREVKPERASRLDLPGRRQQAGVGARAGAEVTRKGQAWGRSRLYCQKTPCEKGGLFTESPAPDCGLRWATVTGRAWRAGASPLSFVWLRID